MSTKRPDLIGLTPTGGLARPKTGGRKVGSKNKLQISQEMTDDILTTYQSLGGPKWLLAWARKNETDFVKQVLSRLLPTPPRNPETTIENNVVIGSELSDIEIARRIAFALNKGVYALKGGYEPHMTVAEWQARRVLPFTPEPAPADQWREPPATPTEPSIETYVGGAGEQGLGQPARKRKLI